MGNFTKLSWIPKKIIIMNKKWGHCSRLMNMVVYLDQVLVQSNNSKNLIMKNKNTSAVLSDILKTIGEIWIYTFLHLYIWHEQWVRLSLPNAVPIPDIKTAIGSSEAGTDWWNLRYLPLLSLSVKHLYCIRSYTEWIRSCLFSFSQPPCGFSILFSFFFRRKKRKDQIIKRDFET